MKQSVYSNYHVDLNLTNGALVSYKDSPGSANHKYHLHDEFELLLCLSDDMFLDMDETYFDVHSNTLILMNNTDLHHFAPKKADGENIRYVLNFTPSFFDFLSSAPYNLLDCFMFRPFDNCPILPLDQEETARVRAMMDELLALQEGTPQYGSDLQIKLKMSELMLFINRLYYHYHNVSPMLSSENRQIVYSVMNYIRSHYAEDLSLDLLSETFYISKYNLCVIFKRIAGVSPGQYIINWRITKAKQLLINGLSVEATCSSVGFNNLSHFSRTFKSRVGVNPKQYQLASSPQYVERRPSST